MTEQKTLIKTKPNSKALAIDMPNMRESAPPKEDSRLLNCRILCHQLTQSKILVLFYFLTVYVFDSMTDSTLSVS